MTDFTWTDRNGVDHHLTSPAMIDAETQAVVDEIDKARVMLSTAQGDEQHRLRNEIRIRLARFTILQSDVARWNEHAAAANTDAATLLVSNIDRFETSLIPLRRVVSLHEEVLDLLADADGDQPVIRGAMQGPMTTLQREAIAASEISPKPGEGITRGEAHDWLQADPVFSREYSDEGGWFEWQDGDGLLRRLSNPLSIEVEIVMAADELQVIRKGIMDEMSQYDTARAIEEASDLTDRVIVLQGDLERFIRQAKEREDEQWTRFEKEWIASRAST